MKNVLKILEDMEGNFYLHADPDILLKKSSCVLKDFFESNSVIK